MRKLIIAASAAVVALGLVACEKSQVVTYKQGKYQGKTDNPPWENEQFKGDREAWDKALKVRNQAQNEYKRSN
ncbi:MAG: hypothetical protein H0U63_04850 [Burkholderiales bacterium]|nr:hypothetical protein [Burkholderiales bacterium]